MEDVIAGFNEGVRQALADYPRRMGFGELFAEGIGRIGELNPAHPKDWLQAYSYGYQTYWEALENYKDSQAINR